jgi:D-lactate dehydrogenase (cytochrome)
MLIKKDPDIIRAYLEDYSNIQGGSCDSVMLPENEEDVQSILRQESDKGKKITVSGAGTGVTGGRVPFGGDLLSLEKLDRIEYIKVHDDGRGEACLEPGVVLSDFLKKVDEYGLFYPPDPTEKGSSLGGNVSTQASGARSFRFGTTREFVDGLRIIIPTGEILDIRRGEVFASKKRTLSLKLDSGRRLDMRLPGYNIPSVKNAAGYFIKDGMDAIDLFIGQEGTLGIITAIRLKLLPRLNNLLDCYCFFRRLDDGLDFTQKARDAGRKAGKQKTDAVNPISIEFFDYNSLSLLREKHKLIPSYAQAAV